MEKQVKDFADFEKPKRLIFARKEWTVETGELTPQLSVRINDVMKKYEEAIEKAYEEEESTAAKTVKILIA